MVRGGLPHVLGLGSDLSLFRSRQWHRLAWTSPQFILSRLDLAEWRLGYLSQLVATMPSWIALAITQNELDLKPPGGGGFRPPATDTNQKLLQAFEDARGTKGK